MPGKPYDREFEKQRWAIIREQKAQYVKELTPEQRAIDLYDLFCFWRERFLELDEQGYKEKPSGLIAFRKRYAARRSTP